MLAFFERWKKEPDFSPRILTTDKSGVKGAIHVSGEFLAAVCVELVKPKEAIIYHTDEFATNSRLKTIESHLINKGIHYTREEKTVTFIRQKNGLSGYEQVRSVTDKVSVNDSTFDAFLARAIQAGSSDLRFHLRKDLNTCAITHKIDNRVVFVESISYDFGNSVIAHVFSNIADDTSHERGKAAFSPTTIDQGCAAKRSINGRLYNIRYKSVPEAFGGYDVTLRIQPQESSDGEIITLESLGFPASAIAALRRSKISRAAVIACGRVGVGKTTTLYALMQKPRDDRSEYVASIEDPVEYRQFGVTQVNVDKVGHVEAMKTVLRIGADTVLVGEIRDHVMGKLFLIAQSTGQKIFTTTHETSAFGGFMRLIDEEIQLKPTSVFKPNILGTVFAQELIAKLCPHCKIPATPENLKTENFDYYAELTRLHVPLHNVFRRNKSGCPHCNFQGTKGRLPVIEIVECTEKLLKQMWLGNYEAAEKMWRDTCTTSILEEDITGKPMIASGLYLVYQGLADIEDVVFRISTNLREFEPTVSTMKVLSNAA